MLALLHNIKFRQISTIIQTHFCKHELQFFQCNLTITFYGVKVQQQYGFKHMQSLHTSNRIHDFVANIVIAKVIFLKTGVFLSQHI